MKKEKCGLRKLHKGFWLCLCAVALVVTCCVVVLSNVQAADTTGWVYALDGDKGGYVLEKVPATVSNSVEIPAEYEGENGKHPVVAIGREAFLGCEGMTGITIPKSVTSIGWYAFSGCTGLTEITIPDSVTEMDWFAFSNCTGLETVTIGSGLKTISAGAFSGCTGLTNVRIGECVASIGWSAFKDCTGLETVTIPRKVTQVDRYAFYKCNSLASVYYTGLAAEWKNIHIGTGNDNLTNANRPVATTAEFSEKVANNLRMKSLIAIGYGFNITTNGTTDNVQYGMLVWEDEAITEPTIGEDGSVVAGVTNKSLTYDAGYYTGEGEGIYAQRLDQEYYARPYVKIGGEYTYGDKVTYSPLEYAKTVLEDESKDAALKKMMVDMLNYGACAQSYFATQTGAAPDKLINADLTDEQKKLASEWNDNLKVPTPELIQESEATLQGQWASNLNLLDAIQLNVAIQNSSVTEMYYWTGTSIEDVTENSLLFAEVIEENFKKDGTWTIASFPGVVAQDIGKWHCVQANDDAGNYSAIRADSVAAYATRLIDKNSSSETVALAKALILYGNSAKAYFNPQNG